MERDSKKVWFGNLPVVRHGTVTFAQSGAVQKYFSALSQKWKLLTPQQVAVDDMFAAYLEDLFLALFKVKDDANAIPTLMDNFSGRSGAVGSAGWIHPWPRLPNHSGPCVVRCGSCFYAGAVLLEKSQRLHLAGQVSENQRKC